jgi:diguanylate cyclase (GGDEF)-like protein
MLKFKPRSWEMPDASASGDDSLSMSPVSLAHSESLSAIIACRDRASQKWGPRWLERSGFDVTLASSGWHTLSLVDDEMPAVAIIEAGLHTKDKGGKPIYEMLLARPLEERPPLVVLCANEGETRSAIEAGATDVARRPWDWRLISRRAAFLARSIEAAAELGNLRQALDKAVSLAEDARQHAEQRAATDPLTELPNRQVFLELLELAMGAYRSEKALVSVLLLDLDRFGAINESLGREGGNEVLTLVGQRLTDCLYSSDLIAARASGLVSAVLSRVSSDEFAIMISNLSDVRDLEPLSEDILEVLSQPFEIDDHPVYLTASMGAACFPGGGDTAQEVLQHAEMAMLEAKEQGGGLLRFYDSSLNERARQRVTLDRELRQALQRRELFFEYQPLVDLASGKVVAAEALLRWQHPQRGVVEPLDFIPVAEETGLMVKIGAWGLRTACRQLRTWIDQGMQPIRMTVNISHCQLTRGDLLADVQEALSESNLDPALLELELSERGVLQRTPEILELLDELKALGVRLSIDDFGTGDSAIAYVKSLPVDVLKIDRSYVAGASSSSDDATIAAAMVAMAHQLDLKVVAEGIESSTQIENAQSWGCDEFQGFHFSPPVSGDEFLDLMTDTTQGPTTAS